MLKTIVKKIVGPKLWHMLKAATGRLALDEVDVVYELLREENASGVMIDVGAHHGGSLEQFAEDGWKVFAFEPDPKNRAILSELCTKYPAVNIDTRAVSDKNQDKLPFYTSEVSSGISSLSSFHDSHKESSCVDTVTLDAFFQAEAIQTVDFLKIDTEGHDLFVLKGIPWGGVQPRVILCEFEDRKTKPLGYDFHDLAQFLQDNGYFLLVSEWYPMVEYGTRHKWRRFSSYPCDLADDKAWGNIIAVNNDGLNAKLSTISQKFSQRFS